MSKFEGINFNIIHSRQEGSSSNSTALRVTTDLIKDISLSANWVLSIDEEGNDSSAYSLDASWRVTDGIDLSGEVATSSSGGGEIDGDIAYRVAANYRARSFSASVGYQDIAKNFRADSAYLPNGTSPDNHGIDMQLSYRASGNLLFFERPSFGLQVYNQATESGDDINEYRGNFRFNLFRVINVGLDYQYAESPDYDRNGGSFRLSAPLWRGGNLSARMSFSNSGTYDNLALYTDLSFRLLSHGSLRMSYQWNRQESTDNDSEEENLYTDNIGQLIRIDAGWKNTHALVQYRITDKDEGENNFYVRADQSFDMMGRFMFTVYAAYGDLSSLSTNGQLEAGVEMRF